MKNTKTIFGIAIVLILWIRWLATPEEKPLDRLLENLQHDTTTVSSEEKYLETGSWSNNRLPVRCASNRFWSIIDPSDQTLCPCMHHSISDFHEGLARYQDRDDRYGFLDTTGSTAIDSRYHFVNHFYHGVAYASYAADSAKGIINTNGDEVVPLIYDAVGYYLNGIVWVKKGDKYGYFDLKGKKVTDLIYESFGQFFNQYAVVKKGEKWGLIDNTGTEVVACQFDDVNTTANEGFLGIKKGGKWGYWDIKAGKMLVAPKYTKVYPFQQGFAVVNKGAYTTLINTQGKEICPAVYDDSGFPKGGKIRVAKNEKWGYLDLATGTEITTPIYDESWDFSSERAMVKQDGKYGFVDGSGHEIIPTRYDDAVHFHPNGDWTAVKKGDRWIFVDKNGIEQTQLGDFSSATRFAEGRAIVDGNRIIDKNGNTLLLLEMQADDCWSFSEGLAAVKKGSKWGFINYKGELVIPYRYSRIGYFSEGYALAEYEDDYGYIDKKGNWVVAPQFDEAYDFHQGAATVKYRDWRYRLEIQRNLPTIPLF